MLPEREYVTYVSNEPATSAGENESPPRGVQSIEVGFRLIHCLEKAQGALTLKALAEGAGLSPSRARFYLVSFLRLGLIAQERHHGRYELGPYARYLGLTALRRMDVVQAAEQPLRGLCEALDEGGYLSVWGNQGPTIVLTLDGVREVPMSVRIGYVLPLLNSATGRVFLSHLPRQASKELVHKELAAVRSELGAAAAQELSANIDNVVEACRAAGYARTEGLLNTGFAGVAAPIFDYRGSIAAAVTAIGLRHRLDDEREREVVGQLRKTAAEISAELGFRLEADRTASTD